MTNSKSVLPEPTILMDMDWMENAVYDTTDLIKYGNAEYNRAIADVLALVLEIDGESYFTKSITALKEANERTPKTAAV